MTLKNPSANCLRKFKGLPLTFQVVLTIHAEYSYEWLPGSTILTFPYRDFSKYGCGFPDDTS